MSKQVIVVGGGLSGLSAAHSLLQKGISVCLIERNAFMGGNSTKATSGINGAETRTQDKLKISDPKKIFYEDTVRSASGIKKGPLPEDAWYDLGKVLTYESTEAIHWIQDYFKLSLDTTSRLGGHSNPRTHRSSEGGKFPGMEITYALMKSYEQICKDFPKKARFLNRARVNKLLTDGKKVRGVRYEKDGSDHEEQAEAVVIATGGFGAGGLFEDSLLKKVRPDLYDKLLPTTNGSHCVGDGIKIATEIGAGTKDIEDIQVHPTGLVNPLAPKERTIFLAAEALRGEGGILLDRDGNRFCNELGTRDYVTGCMWEHDKAPYFLVLNSKSSSTISWHCSHYVGRGVMKKVESGKELCLHMGIQESTLVNTFNNCNEFTKNDSDPWGKRASFVKGSPWTLEDSFHIAQVTPVIHYTMGGILIDSETRVLTKKDNKPIPGLFSCGEATGGVHGKNRLGGSALLECVVFGRKAGNSISNYLKSSSLTLEEVAKHNTERDCWIVVNNKVLDVTEFMNDHPGGKMAIMNFAGKDATSEFNMLHDAEVIEKYASNTIIGDLCLSSSKL